MADNKPSIADWLDAPAGAPPPQFQDDDQIGIFLDSQSPDDSADYSSLDTKLTPPEETQFQAWKQKNAPNDSGADYDMRGAFKAGLQPAANGHWPDTFKKPNHPTFSNESKFAKDYPSLAGHWDGDTYVPPQKFQGVPQPTVEDWLDKPEDTWAQLGTKVIENAPALVKQGAAGIEQMTAERPISTITSTVAPAIGGEALNGAAAIGDVYFKNAQTWLRDKLGMEPDKSAEMAQKLYQDTAQDLQDNAPNVDPDSLKGYAYDAAQSVVQMVPGIVAGLVTKNPAVGAATLAAPIAGQEYAKARQEGKAPDQAGQAAAVFGLAEAIPEMLPLGVLMKPGKRFLMRALQTAGAEGLSEVMTQAIEDGYSKGILKEDMTWGQVWSNLKRAGIIGTLVGGTVGAASHAVVPNDTNRGAENTPPPAAAASTGESAGPPPASPPPTEAAAATTPVDLKVNDTVGIKNGENPPARATIEGVQDGWVFWRDENDNLQTDREAEFRRDLTTPPPARRGDLGETAEPSGLPTPPPSTESDINDFDPYAINESKRAKKTEPSPQSSMPLSDTRQIQALRDAASAHLTLAAQGERSKQRTPEWVSSMRVAAAKLMDQAAELEAKLTPSRTAPDATAATPEQMAARGMGKLSAAAPASSEATTGAQEFEVTPPKAPPVVAQPNLEPVAGSEAENPQEPQLKPKDTPVPWQQRLRQRLGERSAKVSDPALLAKQLGVTEAEINSELTGIAANPKGPIRIVRGTLKKNAKTGETVQSKMAGKFQYVAKPTGNVKQSLSDLVYDSGGMAAGKSFGAELEARDLHTAKRPFKGNLIKPGARMNVQDMADHAMQLGWQIKPDSTGNHADVDDFLNKLEQDHDGSRKHYALGEEPIEEPEKPASPKQRKDAALARLQQLGFEPKGTTHEELEQQIDDYESAIGDMPRADTLDLHRTMEQENVDLLPAEAQTAVKEEVPDDYPHEYDEGWYQAESGGTAPPALDEAHAGDEAGHGPAGTVPESAGADQGGAEGANAPARRIGEAPASKAETGGIIARLLADESGSLNVPDWKTIREFFSRGKKEKTPAQVASEGLRVKIGQPDTLQSLSKLGQWFRTAVSLAAIDKPSSVYWNALLRTDHLKTGLERAAVKQVAPYLGLDQKARDRVNKVMEHDRLYGIDRADTGRTVVVKIPDRRTPFGAAHAELSKPGEIVALDAKETAAIHQLRKFFDTRLMQMGEAVARERGYTGPFTKSGIQQAIDAAGSPRQRKPAEAALAIFEQTEEMRRTGYVPFQRYGDTFILIKPKANALDETAWFELVDTKSVFDSVYSRPGGKPRGKLDERTTELEKRFPRDKFDWRIEQATPKAVSELNIPALERAFATLNLKADGTTAKIVDDLMHEIYESRKAGLRKQAQNIPGYNLDFERAITDYVRQTSAIISRMSTRQDVDSAYQATQAHPAKEVRQYWESYNHHMDKEGGDYAGLRKFGFWMFLASSPASAAVNLTQTPLVTQMQLATWAGLRAPGLAHGAMLEALHAIRVGKTGLEVNLSSIGKTEPEKAMIRALQAEGRLDPIITQEFRGFDKGRSALRPHLNALGRIMDIASSGFNATETVNRAAAALAYFRAAQNPQLREKMMKVYAQDQNFKEMVGRNPDPVDIARFGVDETQFIGGKINRMPAMRGFGAVALQFKTYIANYIRLLHKNFTRMGPQGKAAGAAMLMSLIMMGGLAGLPFGDDALGAADGIMKMVDGIDHNLEYQFRSWLADHGFGEYGAEVMTRGFGRNAFGVDVGGRLGMGNIFPDNSYTSLAPILTGTVAAVAEAYKRANTGQPLAAAGALAPMVISKGGADLYKGLVTYPNEGISTKAGNWTVKDPTLADMTVRSLGFQPTKATRAGEKNFMANRIANATQEARTNMLTRIARLVVRQQDAATAGDADTARAVSAQIEALYADNAAQMLDPDIPDWQKIRPASRLAVKRKVQALIAPEIARMKRAGKMSREELNDMPLVEP